MSPATASTDTPSHPPSHTSVRARPRRGLLRALLPRLLGLAILLALCLAGCLWGLKVLLRPAQGEWATTLRWGPWYSEVGVPALIQWATVPGLGVHLDGRIWHSRYGPVRFQWLAGEQALALHCQPCTVHSPAWGTQPLHLAAVTLTVRRSGSVLSGTLQSGAVRADWTGVLRAQGMSVQVRLPPTEVAGVYALVSQHIPEWQQITLRGTLALQATIELPSGRFRVAPRVEGLQVSGLGTEAWAHGRSRCAMALQGAGRIPAVDSWLAHAVVAAEDQRFFEHPGYDLDAMVQALHHNQSAGTRTQLLGGSTLTQQLAKLLVTGDDRTPARKLRELLYAVEMEQTLGKARILRLYLDHAPWGPGLCGARAAALHYMGQRADRLEPWQAVWLASMLRNPTLESERWRESGEIDLTHARWVARHLRGRPLSAGQHADLGLFLRSSSSDAPATGRLVGAAVSSTAAD